MSLLYLDTCALQRPLDDRAQLRVRLEAEAVEAVLRAVEHGSVTLLSSDVLAAESGAVLDPVRLGFARRALSHASATVALSDAVALAAGPFVALGVKAIDALHLASAVAGGAAFFCTVDDRFLRAARRANTGLLRVVTPFDLALALDL